MFFALRLAIVYAPANITRVYLSEIDFFDDGFSFGFGHGLVLGRVGVITDRSMYSVSERHIGRAIRPCGRIRHGPATAWPPLALTSSV